MALDTAEEMPNLEDIAKKYAVYEEEEQLDQIVPRLMDTFVNAKFSDGKSIKYTTEDGVVKYKTELSDKQKDELAEKLSKSLAYHAYILKYGAKPSDFEGFLKLKSKTGQYLSDSLLASEFGVNREVLKDELEKMPKITANLMLEKFSGFIKHQKKILESSILGPIMKDKYTPHIKEFVKKSLIKYGGDTEEEAEKKLSNIYEIKGALGAYTEIAPYYKKKKTLFLVLFIRWF